MQLEMTQVINNHCLQRNFFSGCLVGNPNVAEGVFIHVPNDVGIMQVGVFPQGDEKLPVFVLVILDGDPAVVLN